VQNSVSPSPSPSPSQGPTSPRSVDEQRKLQEQVEANLVQKGKGSNDNNVQLEQEIKQWIESVTGEKLSGGLGEALKNGVVLCNLINKLKPNTIKKINKATAAFSQMENINSFLNACKSLGLSEGDLFMSNDLYSEKNLSQVLVTIQSLRKKLAK